MTAVEKAFTDLAARARPNESVVVLLIGHGSFDGTQAAFNLPGPDLTVPDWARLLGKLSAQRVAFVNTTSSSGAFLPAIAAPGRVVVTATKTGGERNETLFPEPFVEAFNDDAADRDRNGHVSIGEAFEYAKAKVVQAFQQKGLLLTEHATLDEGTGGADRPPRRGDLPRDRARRGCARGRHRAIRRCARSSTSATPSSSRLPG